MGRKLNTTVQLGGVIYPAGTDEGDIDGKVTASGVWATVSSDAEDAIQAAVDSGLAAAKAEIARLTAELEAARKEAAAGDASDEGDDAGDDADAPLAKWKLPALKDELARRNAERSEDDQIVPAEPGNKPEIVAALEADDAASASA